MLMLLGIKTAKSGSRNIICIPSFTGYQKFNLRRSVIKFCLSCSSRPCSCSKELYLASPLIVCSN
jgi:hypothetical protein